MRKILFHWSAPFGIAASLVFTSCTYDPYYSSVSASYGTGYGDGYGYGGSSFSTSVFVSTGDSRWGYDPNTYCYYDYRSRRYYDPYLYGYYPVGYRPPVVYGVPHPHGWRPGHGYCPPPRTVRNVVVANYHNREAAYRGSNYNWARQVNQAPHHRSSYQGSSRSPQTFSNSQQPYLRGRDAVSPSSRSNAYLPQAPVTRNDIRNARNLPEFNNVQPSPYRGGYRETKSRTSQPPAPPSFSPSPPSPQRQITQSWQDRTADRARSAPQAPAPQIPTPSQMPNRRANPRNDAAPPSFQPPNGAFPAQPMPHQRRDRRDLRGLGNG